MLAKSFTKKWERKEEPILRRVEGKLHPKPPLRERLSTVMLKLTNLNEKLKQSVSKMEQKSRDFFDKCVKARSVGDTERAAIYANECAQLREMAEMVLRGQIAIEQVVLRLETVEEFGDVAAQVAPLHNVLSALKGPLSKVVPEASYELNAISSTLGELVLEAGETFEQGWSVSLSSDESEKILAEANAVAEQRVKEMFPKSLSEPSKTDLTQ